jgi:hypothetical protein
VPIKFSGFLKAFPPDPSLHRPIEGLELRSALQSQLGASVPEPLIEFWSEVGSGFFGDRELYVFGLDEPKGNLVAWNGLKHWRDIFPSPADGGPVFFAETCMGVQIGYRWEAGRPIGVLFDLDAFDMFGATGSFEGFLARDLASRDALPDVSILGPIKKALGGLEEGQHYSPLVSPRIGGSSSPDNYQVEDRLVHLVTSLAMWKATKDLPPGTRISGIDIRWSEGSPGS